MRFRGDLFNVVLVSLLLGVAGWHLSDVPRMQMERGQWVAHTQQVLHQLEMLSSQLSDARDEKSSDFQSNARVSLERYDRIVHGIGSTIAAIADLTKDNAVQQARIEPIRRAIADRLAILSPTAAAEDADIAQNINAMSQEEERLLKEREDNWRDIKSAARLQFLVVIAVIYLLILNTIRLSRRDRLVQKKLLVLESEKTAMHQRMAERMSKVVEVQQDIIDQRLNYQGAMEVITRRTQEITNADGAVIELQDEQKMVYRAASGTMGRFVGFRINAVGSMSGLCMASRTALRCDDSETDSRVDKEACRKVGVRSMIVVPLQQKEEIVGVLKVASGRVNAFTTDDINTLQLMAGVLSATLRDAALSEELKTRADTDGMTGLKNHRYFQDVLAKEFIRSDRYHNQLSVILCDVDHFKKYNDQFGHQAGDMVLAQVGALLRKQARPSDCVARYGGEEFAIILTQTPLAGATSVANRICEAMRNEQWPHGAVTMSLGVSGLENGATNPSALVEQADKALYQSKTAGRNRVTSSGLNTDSIEALLEDFGHSTRQAVEIDACDASASLVTG